MPRWAICLCCLASGLYRHSSMLRMRFFSSGRMHKSWLIVRVPAGLWVDLFHFRKLGGTFWWCEFCVVLELQDGDLGCGGWDSKAMVSLHKLWLPRSDQGIFFCVGPTLRESREDISHLILRSWIIPKSVIRTSGDRLLSVTVNTDHTVCGPVYIVSTQRSTSFLIGH